MGTDTVSLNLEVNKYIKKLPVAAVESKQDSTFVFASDESAERVSLEKQKELVAELERKLSDTKDRYENGNGERAFIGGLITTFLLGASIRSEETRGIRAFLLKTTRKIRNPKLKALFTIGSAVATFVAPYAIIIPVTVLCGKENDRNHCSILEEKLANEQAKLEAMQRELEVA